MYDQIIVLFVAVVIVGILIIDKNRHSNIKISEEVERQAKVLSGLAVAILSFELTSVDKIHLVGIIIASFLTMLVWILVWSDKCSLTWWRWIVKFIMSIDIAYIAISLSFGVFANKIPLLYPCIPWVRLFFLACCYIFLGISGLQVWSNWEKK